MKRDEIQEQCLREILKHERCSAQVGMGIGKTKISIDYLATLYTGTLKVLVIVPKLSIMQSWKDEIEKFNFDYLLGHIKFSTYLSLNKQDTDYDVVILDEAHNVVPRHVQYLDKHKGKILGLSGTLPKYEHSDKYRIINHYCPKVFEYNIDEAIDDLILNDYKIIVHSVDLGTAKDFKVKNWSTSEAAAYKYWTDRIRSAVSPKQQQIMQIMRMKTMMEFKSKPIYAKKLFDSITDKCIIFANTQAQADYLCPHSYHSKNDSSKANLEMFINNKILKLAAVNQLSEGVNIPGLKQAIVLHSYSGSSPRSNQKLGRILRLSKDEVATLHILMHRDTVDTKWVSSVLDSFNETRVFYK